MRGNGEGGAGHGSGLTWALMTLLITLLLLLMSAERMKHTAVADLGVDNSSSQHFEAGGECGEQPGRADEEHTGEQTLINKTVLHLRGKRAYAYVGGSRACTYVGKARATHVEAKRAPARP